MLINFLSADMPLVKTFTVENGVVHKDDYPDAFRFTSFEHEVNTAVELNKLISSHGSKGHCLLKGRLNKALVNERRKGTTSKTDSTEWICLDFDRHRADSVEEELNKLGVGDITYTLQWSSSQGMPGTEGTLSCHVFMLLSAPVKAGYLKSWLQNLNFKHYESGISLSSDANGLKWGLDVTTCQNDKLLYLGNPKFVGFKDPIKGPRIEYIKRVLDKLPVARLGELSPEIIKKLCVDKKNQLKKAAGLPVSRAGTTFVGEHEVQNRPAQCSVRSIKDAGEYIRLNLNDGESFAHWHFKDNFELLFSFKDTDIAFRMKEILPDYYADLVQAAAAAAASPNANGDLVLAFRDKRTASYWNGIWNPETEYLDLHPAKSETQLDHWMQAHGTRLGSYVPIWDMTYLPESNWIIDSDRHIVNCFVRTIYMRNAEVQKVPVVLKRDCPTIFKILNSMLGEDDLVHSEFLNWFSCFFKRTGKPITSWTMHGNEGTGKGVFFERIATPLLGHQNVMIINMNTIQDSYNAWLKHKLLIVVNEVDVDSFTEKGVVTSLLKTYITDNTISIRDMRTISYNIINTAGLMFFSNKDQPVYIPATDRRYNVARFQFERLILTDKEVFELIPAELQTFANYLTALEGNVERASKIVDTPDRRRIAKLAVTSLQETANAVLRGDLESLWNSMPDEKHLNELSNTSPHMAFASAYATLIKNCARDYLDNKPVILTREELRTVFEYCVGNTSPTPNKFTSMLRHNGIELKRIRRKDDYYQALEMNWKIEPEFRDFLIQYFVIKPPLKLRKVS